MGSTLVFLVLLLIGSFGTFRILNAEARFSYDPSTSLCIDAQQKVGLNPFKPEILFAGIDSSARNQLWPARNAQCIDFAQVQFSEYLGSNYHVLDHWDFRGSNFSGAKLQFNFFDHGLFKGSNVKQLSIGYGRVRATDIEFDEGDMEMPVPRARP